MNLTDVGHLADDADSGEDKMEPAARKSGRDIRDLSRLYTAAFFEHLGDLAVVPPVSGDVFKAVRNPDLPPTDVVRLVADAGRGLGLRSLAGPAVGGPGGRRWRRHAISAQD